MPSQLCRLPPTRPLAAASYCMALLLVLLLCPLPAQSSQAPCKPRYPTPQALAAMYDLAALTADTLDVMDSADVFIVARSGQDLTRYGLNHSHLAFLLRDKSNNWQVIHLLNHCKSDVSSLHREGLVNFIGETAESPAGIRIGILAAPIRAAIAQLLAEPASQVRRLHQPRYSAVAYPWRTDFQNSNQWILEVIAAAMAQTFEGRTLDNRKASAAWLQQQGYTPSRLPIGLIKRLGARFLVKNATTTDHPWRERLSGHYSVVTVESVFDFLQRSGALERDMILVLPPVTPAISADLEVR